MCYSSLSHKRVGTISISRTTACNAAAIHKKGGKHQTLQKFGLINIWTAAEGRQTELCQRLGAAQLASLSWRKHFSDKRQIRLETIQRHIVTPSSFGNTTLSELTKHSTPALTTPVKMIKSVQFQVCVCIKSHRRVLLDSLWLKY